MKNKECIYYVSYSRFDLHSVSGHGIETFTYDHRDTASPRDWLGKMFDVCMDADHAIVFLCDREPCSRGFEEGYPIVVPVFMYDGCEGFMLHTRKLVFSPVVDPSLEDYDCLIDDYEAFHQAAIRTLYDRAGNPTFYPDGMDKKYFVQEGDL